MTDGLTRQQVAWRIAQDMTDGSFVNLGIGQPELVANFLPEDREIIFHSENGILGMGPEPAPEDIDEELINAGKKPITLLPGGAIFHHADSFSMIRGGHIDACVLGAFQIAENGDLANWSIGSSGVPAVGGAMDLAVGAKRVLVMTDHCTKKGEPKLVEKCSYPLTGPGVVNTVYTDLAVIDVTPEGFLVRERVENLPFEELQNRTGARLTLANDWHPLTAP
ncbi:MAG: 3-oxoacid CoA-transferase subunit B [Pseudomonadota bacterium]|nr:3-oxoacid CoA-transferase subunit B [Pseudomonadota bacterium]